MENENPQPLSHLVKNILVTKSRFEINRELAAYVCGSNQFCSGGQCYIYSPSEPHSLVDNTNMVLYPVAIP